MPLFQDYNTATREDTPDFLRAEIDRATAENAIEQAENQQKSNDMMGAAKLYNYSMGDSSPIADALKGWMGGGSGGANNLVGAGDASMTPDNFSGALIDPVQPDMLAPDSMGFGEMAGGPSALPEAGMGGADAMFGSQALVPDSMAGVMNAGAGTAGAGTAGAGSVMSSGAGMANPLSAALTGAMLADRATDGASTNAAMGDPKAVEDMISMAFGKGWLWS